MAEASSAAKPCRALLDSPPEQWGGDHTAGSWKFPPLSYHFGFMPTPVKEFPADPYPEKILHLDCFVKIKGNYIDFLRADNRFDRLAEKGVTTLILHEKWNKSQNHFELSEHTASQLREIVAECHRRGVKVLTYFGYEISSMSPEWTELADSAKAMTEAGLHQGGWYRVPYQRDYCVCYNSDYSSRFVDGIVKIVDEFGIDGV